MNVAQTLAAGFAAHDARGEASTEFRAVAAYAAHSLPAEQIEAALLAAVVGGVKPNKVRALARAIVGAFERIAATSPRFLRNESRPILAGRGEGKDWAWCMVEETPVETVARCEAVKLAREAAAAAARLEAARVLVASHEAAEAAAAAKADYADKKAKSAKSAKAA